ncbi:flagellar basal body-associated protein FliL [Pseudomonas typographi]|uniref:Flagellar protein FliL n=1 Tax=Pseudomonas typographi TaxID=2715964 RepID=A0ABR7Z4T9_9PSED|nr:flagellar basal body-associated protein FliL [Pseudomonas typographi]MBD1588027.1 flagellar basal body-associated protein FliL [Pseudomonas typographi]MBD1600419.1 flagellar basal body-associated protein FliL [Pseudomonas typographi]
MAKNDPVAGDTATPAKQGKLKFIILMVLVLLVAIGGSVAGTWFFLHKSQNKDEKPADAATVATAKPAAIYEALQPAFVVNLAQQGRQRYLQVSITLMSHDAEGMAALKEHMPVIRNNLVLLLSGQDFNQLASPVGTEMLRQKATASVQEVAQKEIGKLVVDQLLFTNFVLQ